jgi:hypothetical protein
MEASEKHIVKRDGDLDLAVSGVLLADVSGQSPTSTKWTELALYRSASGRYILARERMKVRRTMAPGDVSSLHTAHEAVVLEDAAAVIAHLRERSEGQLGRLDKELLDLAAVKDEAIRALLTEEV